MSMDKNQRKPPVIFADYRNTITGDVNMNINNNTIFKVAIYLRLSKEDGNFSLNGKFESNSINSQREIIMNYLKKHPEMEIYDEYKDDGKTGTNFERNEFQRMYDDVRLGKVNCIIVKDLSRFGRDYIDCGRYIEKEFPSMNVRFIAINDNFDNFNAQSTDNLILPFKNLINDSYSRDISIKIRSNLEIKRKQGEFISNFAVYGYKKHPDNKNQLIVD
jgi:DNA invertase Pin-like site-specific DNA recombinase